MLADDPDLADELIVVLDQMELLRGTQATALAATQPSLRPRLLAWTAAAAVVALIVAVGWGPELPSRSASPANISSHGDASGGRGIDLI